MQVVIAAHQHQRHHHQQNHAAGEYYQQNLPIQESRGGNKPQNTDQVAAGRYNRSRYCHYPFIGIRIFPNKRLNNATCHRLLNFRCVGGLARPGAIGGGNQVSLTVNKLQFDFIFPLVSLGIGHTGLIVLLVCLIQVIGKKLNRGSCPIFHVGLHSGVVIRRKRCCNDQDTHQSQSQNHTGCI